MKNLVISLQNVLLGEAVEAAFSHTADFRVERVPSSDNKNVVITAEAVNADILLMDVSRNSAASLAARLNTAEAVRKILPDIKVAILCDSNSDPNIAADVKSAKQLGKINVFFYESVTANYLVDALDSL